jgi:hypothetical protein
LQAGGRRFDPVRLQGLAGWDALSRRRVRDRMLDAGSPLLGGVWCLGSVMRWLAGRCWADGCVEMGSLWIVNQVLVRFGRAGRLGGFLRDRVCGLARADGGGP